MSALYQRRWICHRSRNPAAERTAQVVALLVEQTSCGAAAAIRCPGPGPPRAEEKPRLTTHASRVQGHRTPSGISPPVGAGDMYDHDFASQRSPSTELPLGSSAAYMVKPSASLLGSSTLSGRCLPAQRSLL